MQSKKGLSTHLKISLLPVIRLSAILLIGILPGNLASQQLFNEQYTLSWMEKGAPGFAGEDSGIPFFVEAGFSSGETPVPLFVKRVEVPGPGTVNATVNIRQTAAPAFVVNDALRQLVDEEVKVTALIEQERNKYFARIYFSPLISGRNGEIRLVESFSLAATYTASSESVAIPRSTFKDQSELANGTIFKIGVREAGLFKIDADFLSSQLNLNPAEVQVDKIRVLGNRGGMLPQLAAAERVDDLEEIPTRFTGTGTTLSQGGHLLFYAEGPEMWSYNEDNDSYDKPKNIYDDYNYYFVKIGSEDRMEVGVAQQVSGASQYFNTYEFLQRYEVDRVNVLGANPGFYGGGQRWFGDNLSNIRARDYSSEFDLLGFISGTPLQVRTEFIIRSNSSSTARLQVGQENFTRTLSGVNLTSSQGGFASLGIIVGDRTVGNDPLTVNFEITNTGSISESWMDFIQIRGTKGLDYTGQPLIFRDSRTLEHSVSGFDLNNASGQNLLVWDITDPHSIVQMPLQQQGPVQRFSFESHSLRKFIAFNQEQNFPRPDFIEEVSNQNLHGIESAELLIVYHPDFEQQALNLADHRRVFSGLEVVAVPVYQVYNEFGGGSPDPTAIRDLARMFYNRTDKFRYLLLFGDGSYDYRNLMPDLPDQNFVPVYQSRQSLHAITSFPSDDYFALLDPNEGANLIGAIDIAVGRLPVRTPGEAAAVVNKIISYDLNPQSQGDWRLNLGFVADNGDNNLHLNQTRRLVANIKDNYPEYNIQKVYLDAFERVSTPGGNRFPEAKNSINRIMNRGPLVINYLGHGGPSGWSQERVLQIPDITSWSNAESLSLMITATCSFANYDDPAVTSAGEQVVLNPNGGAFGLLTTTRLVFAFANERLNREVLERLFEKDESGANASIGTIMMEAKNANSADTLDVNARKFTLLGDPSQRLAVAQYSVATTSINGKPVQAGSQDTLKALQKVMIEGEIRGPLNRVVTDFNGVVDFTLFDKPTIQATLGQGTGSHSQEFSVQNNILFKGSATVNQGRFEIEFIIPLDINYKTGYGKASYFAYTEDRKTASGAYQDLLIGGSSDEIPEDSEGPEITLYMNDENFVYGGITDPNPILLVLLEDESGINVASNSIGRELAAWLNGDFNNKIVLNDYYQAEKDNFQRGTVNYPFYNLEDGRYELNVVAWDILNNKSEAMLEFIVMSNQKALIDRMLNYPNPFMDHTEFQFEHNLPPGILEVRISIFSVSGRMVKDIHSSVISDGYRVTGIEWNGRDDYGDQLANGVYLYRVNVRSDHKDLNNKTAESKFERLVILR